MSWQDTLTTLLKLATPVASVSAAEHGSTFESAWNDPALKDAREKLLAELTQDGAIQQMIEASQRLREQSAALQKKAVLSPDELKKLGVLTATAEKLSAQALAGAVTSQAIFLYTIQQLLPWLQRAVDVGILIAGEAAKTRDLELDSLPA